MPTFRQLGFFVAIADTLSFSRAAELSRVSQPTISSALAELESELGVLLVERTRHSVSLTPIGAELARRSRAIQTDIKEIVALAREYSHGRCADIRMGAIPTVGPYLLPHAMAPLRQAFPGMRLFLREELSDSLLDGLEAGRLDVVLLALPYETRGLHVEPLFEDRYRLATPKGHPFAGRRNIGGEELARSELLLLEKGHCLQRHALSSFPGVTLYQDESFAATSLPTLIAMVGEDLGITILPDLAIDAGVVRGEHVALTAMPTAMPREIALVWRKTSAQAAIFRKIGKILQSARPRRDDRESGDT